MTQTTSTAPRYHGFTCPKCGSHMFGTHKQHESMGDAYPHGTSVGSCHAYVQGQGKCRFQWNRDDPKAEAEAMYTQSPDEWEASYKAIRDASRQSAGSLVTT